MWQNQCVNFNTQVLQGSFHCHVNIRRATIGASQCLYWCQSAYTLKLMKLWGKNLTSFYKICGTFIVLIFIQRRFNGSTCPSVPFDVTTGSRFVHKHITTSARFRYRYAPLSCQNSKAITSRATFPYKLHSTTVLLDAEGNCIQWNHVYSLSP